MQLGIVKIHHGIMKSDALHDYGVVCAWLELRKRSDEIVQPKGKSTHNIEDATSAMLKKIGKDFQPHLHKGLNYYFTI
jgi:hypothetical protein